MRSKLITLAVGLWMGGFCASNAIAVQIFWITPTGGAFDGSNNWSTGIVPGIMDNPIFDLPAPYSVTFPLLAETGPLNVVEGDVIFEFMAGSSYIAAGVAIGGGLPPAPLHDGALATPVISLAVNGAGIFLGGNITVNDGAALKGSGTVISNGLIINEGGQLLGSLTVIPDPNFGGVVNSGAVAPGDGAGSLTIDGDYEQSASGLLEIEVGGLAAGNQHDQLLVTTSSVMLAGRLDVPFINAYTPMVGHNIPFLLAGSITPGFEFDIISLPDYQEPPVSPVAVQVVYLMESVSLSFVTPTMVSTAGFDPNTPISFWGDASTWTGAVPITSDVVDLINSDPSPTRVNLDVGTQASKRAFAHEVNISSMSPAAPSTLGIPSGTNLSAISRVAVGANGIVEMSGGAVFTNLVEVAGGGTVLGNGTIAGDVILGSGLGGEATLNPGSPGSAAGVINVENLTINSEGVLAVAIVDPNSFGQVIVEGTASLGGRLVIDATNYTAAIGTTFDVVVAGALSLGFDSIETVGGGGSVFFAPVVLSSVISPDIAALITCSDPNVIVAMTSHTTGDMDLDGGVDGDDAADFVQGLLDPDSYEAAHCEVDPGSAGDFSGDLFLDFDDIEGFVAEVGTLVAADIYALIEQMSVPEPTSCGLLLLGSGLLGATRSRRFKRSVRRSG